MIKLLILLISGILMTYIYRRGRLLSSVSIWILCYNMIFVVYPLWGLNKEIGNGELIDVLALVGILSFTFGTILAEKHRFVIGTSSTNNYQSNRKQIFPSYKLAHMLFWIIFAITIYIIVTKLGVSGIRRLLNGQVTAKKLALTYDITSGSYVFAVHLLVPCVLVLWVTANTRKERIISLIALSLYVIETLLFGFTRIFLITILCIIFFYSARKMEKGRQLRLAIISAASLVLLMVFMNFIRTFGLQSQTSFSERLDLQYMFASTDFGASYKWFSRLLEYGYPHISISAYFKPIFAFIPRSIWADKTRPLSLQILRLIDPALASTGYSTAGNSVLGEGFAIMGYFGIVIFPFLWGYICTRLDKRYYQRLAEGNDQCLSNIFYYIFAIFIVISGQRGDWSQYNTIVLYFYMLPMYLMSRVTLGINRNYRRASRIEGAKPTWQNSNR